MPDETIDITVGAVGLIEFDADPIVRILVAHGAPEETAIHAANAIIDYLIETVRCAGDGKPN